MVVDPQQRAQAPLKQSHVEVGVDAVRALPGVLRARAVAQMQSARFGWQLEQVSAMEIHHPSQQREDRGLQHTVVCSVASLHSAFIRVGLSGCIRVRVRVGD